MRFPASVSLLEKDLVILRRDGSTLCGLPVPLIAAAQLARWPGAGAMHAMQGAELCKDKQVRQQVLLVLIMKACQKRE
jgi:hypothetical protein